ncbi:uncharacterized protein LOC128180246 isoform X4 [Crassostrea angulata]|uniref:uncharacterized protein LOC128180246 isoform X4 n=1 Tax=Magallana angulata TaxID=2784310 RepID=UPI0022B120BF|nr:uncharacterized protein LOC128180246 isoform X4 [Crassostrea angulata]
MDDIDGLITRVQSRTVCCVKDNDDIDSSHSMIPHGESTYDEKTQSVRSLDIQFSEIERPIIMEESNKRSENIREENVVGISERDSAEAIDKNKLGKIFQRPSKNDYDKLDASPFVSEIFVKHPDEDSDKGDPLGGFLCTGSRSDGTFLHEFCSLQPDGILAKDLSVREKDILVRLNEKNTLGSLEYDHEGILELFRTLPTLKTISMVNFRSRFIFCSFALGETYNGKSETFTTVEFLLEGTKEEIIVKENSVMLTAQPPSVEALIYQRGNTSLAYQNGQLALCKSANFLTDCTHHFVVKKTLDEGFYNVYTFQVQKNKSKFLGLNGRKLEIIDGTDEAYIKSFQIEKIKRDSFLKPRGKDDMYVYYNKFKGIYEAVSRADALKDEGFGMIIIPTPCQP